MKIKLNSSGLTSTPETFYIFWKTLYSKIPDSLVLDLIHETNFSIASDGVIWPTEAFKISFDQLYHLLPANWNNLDVMELWKDLDVEALTVEHP